MNRLRSYRHLEGINQQELADILGMSTQAVSAVESGRRSFTGDLGLIGYSEGRFDLPEMSEPLHRHRASTTAAAKKRAHEQLRLAGEVFKELQDRTDKAPKFDVDRQPTPESLEDLEELAVDARYLVKHEENGPVKNLTALLERAGICLIPIVGLKGIDGLSAWVDDVPVIGIAPNLPGDRFRFTLAHEFAHLLYHSRRADYIEPQANRFAGAFLFPQEEFDAAMNERAQLRDFVAMKASWGVAVSGLVYRAHELGYIDDARYRSLQIQISKWRRNEPGKFDPVHGTLMGRLVEVNGGAHEVGSQLGVNPQHLDDLVNWNHLRLINSEGPRPRPVTAVTG